MRQAGSSLALATSSRTGLALRPGGSLRKAVNVSEDFVRRQWMSGKKEEPVLKLQFFLPNC